MKNVMILVSFVLGLLVFVPSGHALGSTHGVIDETYDYENLAVREVEGRGNFISGTIVNKTESIHECVTISIYGMDYFDKILWKEVVYMDVIDKNGKFPFCKSIGKEKEPSKISFQVTEHAYPVPRSCREDGDRQK
jgi:hypothetical protein